MKELGDQVHDALQIVGVTPERVEDWLGRPCNCEEYRDKLNRISVWARRIIKGKLESATKYLEQILNE